MLNAALLVFSLAVSAADAPAPAKNYTFDVSQTTQDVQAGKKGTFKLQIKPAEGYKVSPEAPLKIALESAGLELSKKSLGHDDKKDKHSPAPEFTVPFTAPSAGAKSIAVDATFFVCNEKLCERKSEKVTVPVSVRP